MINGQFINKRFDTEAYATNLYLLAVVNKLAKRASVFDEDEHAFLFKYPPDVKKRP
jgi:hypothetical protein